MARRPKMSGTTPRSWVRLWREEKGVFAQLPFFARALEAMLLKQADEDGVIDTGSKPHADAIAYAAGADRSDRRLIRRFLPQLEEAGRIRLDEGRIVLVWWGSEQVPMGDRSDADGDATATRPANDVATTALRPGSDRAVIATRTRNERPANHSKSDGAGTAEKRREEERGEESEKTTPLVSPHEPATPDEVVVVEMGLARASRVAMARAIETASPPGEYQREDRPEHTEVGRTVAAFVAKRGLVLEDVLGEWARDWVALAAARSAKSWLSYAAARAAGKPWKPGNGRSRAAGVVTMKARADEVPEDFGDADFPANERQGVLCG